MKKITIFIITIALITSLMICNVCAASKLSEWTPIKATWDDAGDEGITGEGGGNGFCISEVYVTGEKDFTVEMDTSGTDAYGFGFAIFPDELNPEEDWYCLQADTRSMTFTMFHSAGGSTKLNLSRPFTDEEKARTDFKQKITYVAATKTLAYYIDGVLEFEAADQNVEGYIALKTYECTALFKNILFTGDELPTPAPTKAPTPVPSATPETNATDVPATTATLKATSTVTAAASEDDGGVNPVLLICAGALIIIVGIALVVLKLKKKK